MINGKPETRFEVIDSLYEQLQLAKEQNAEMVFVETWQLAWLLIPERNAVDPLSTGEIAFNVEIEATQRHVVQVRSIEDYLVRVDCDEATEPYKEVGQ